MVRATLPLSFALILVVASSRLTADPSSPFDGKSLAGLKVRGDEKKNKWKVGTAAVDEATGKIVFKEGGSDLVNTEGGGIDIYTEDKYGDALIEVELMVPKGSNSGVYVMGVYEVQVLDSFGKEKVGTGDMGGIYSTAAPKVNASKKAGEWQKFIIDFQAPKFEGDKKVANAKFIKVTLNDQVIHENVDTPKPTGGQLSNTEAPTGPLMFQGDHGPVAYRNLKITKK